MLINTSKYFQMIFISIILNEHNDPCFEDKSSSLTLKYRLVHFSENSCSFLFSSSHLRWYFGLQADRLVVRSRSPSKSNIRIGAIHFYPKH